MTLREMLIQDEGLRLKPYRCTAGALTIGVGHNLDALGIDEDTAMYMLTKDIDRVWRECETAFDFWNDLNEPRQIALANMCFNLGIAGLQGFHRTLNAIKNKEYESASGFMLDSLWARQVGKRAVRLSIIMATGIMTD